MPLNRTPPPTSPGLETRVASTSAAPNNASKSTPSKQNEFKSNVTVRSKLRDDSNNVNVGDKGKKCEANTQSELQAFMKTMCEMFESFKTSIESRLNKIQDSTVKIQSQNTDITNSVQFMSEKHDELLRRIEGLENERSEDRKYIRMLEKKIENFDRRSRSSCIEIRNIPKTKDESKNGLCDILMNLGNTLNLQIDQREIKDIYRTSSTKTHDNRIVVDFCSTLKKDNLIVSFKNFNRNKQIEKKLNTEHIKISGIKKPIFI